MPLREFLCKDCNHSFEFLVLRKSDEEELTCSKCGSRNLETLFSVFGVAGARQKPRSSGGGGCSSCGGGSCSTCGG